MNNDGSIVAKGYGDYLTGNTPTQSGIALVDQMVSQIGGYGKFSQAVRDSLSSGWEAEAGIGGKIGIGGIITQILSGGILEGGISANGRASTNLQGSRTATEDVNADTLRLGVQIHFREIMGRDETVDQKAQDIT